MTAVPVRRARVLVVDDSATQRRKMAIAVRNLGHEPLEAEGGSAALSVLSGGGIDLVILDLLMPDLDGFDVLRAMKADAALAEIPVLVVSALEEARDVARAIALGAADVLTKSFDPILFAARVSASLERARLRRVELDYLAEARKLTDAARVVEHAGFDPAALGLDEVAERDDALGDLARVFTRMATEIRRRELFYDRQVLLLKGALLLLLVAVPYGLMPTLSRTLAETRLHPVGITAYLMLGGAALLVPIGIARGKLPTLSPGRIVFGLQVAIVGTVLPQIAILMAAEQLSASVITVVIGLEPVLVFVLAALLGQEKAEPVRFVGASLGVLAVLLVALPEAESAVAQARPLGMLAALLAVLFYATESILLAKAKDHADDAFQTVTLITMLGAAVTVPLAYAVGVLPPPDVMLTGSGLAIPALVLVSTGATIAYAVAVRRTGAVFASQYAAPLTIAGVLWAMLLLGETPSAWLWIAVPCMIAGLILVGSQEQLRSIDRPSLAGAGPAPANNRRL